MNPKLLYKIENVSKSFIGVKALKNVSLDIYEKQLMGLVGANGAGKSTLLKIIGGVLKPDEGKLFFEGQQQHHLTPYIAQQKGIITVYQELNLFLNKTVAENLFIGKENRTKLGFINWKLTNKEAKDLLDSLGLNIKPNEIVSNLSIAQQHLVEIARAIYEQPKLLLLDEPTSALSEKEIKWLFEKIRDLAQKGTTVIYVSHRLNEVTELCDSCTIMRDGCIVKSLSGNFDKDAVIHHMVGHSITFNKEDNTQSKEDKAEKPSEVVFECRKICSKKVIDASFQVHKGEILGIAGLVGAGRTELLHTIYGITKATSGTITVGGVEKKIRNTQDALASKIALIPEDRKLDGLFMNESVRFNISIETLKNRAKSVLINSKTEKQVANSIANDIMHIQM
jgi:ABC-type sugar transport system ATPase subunit